MRKVFGWIGIAIFLLMVCSGNGEQESQNEATFKISGRVTDLENQPIKGASVFLKDAKFKDVATAKSDEEGYYSLSAPKGRYMALVAVKQYMTKYLEFWAWNVPGDTDLVINPRFDRMEVYAINAWHMYVQENYFRILYFRQEYGLLAV